MKKRNQNNFDFKSNKYFRCGFVVIFLTLFAFIVIKAYDEYLFYINNRALADFPSKSEAYKMAPEKTSNQEEEAEKIIADFVTDNKYDIQQANQSEKQEAKTAQAEATTAKQPSPPQKPSATTIAKSEAEHEQIIALTEPDNSSPLHLIQLGAYSNKENIVSQVGKLSKNFPQLLMGKKFYVKHINQSLYKLFIGPFTNQSEAQEFCLNLRKNGVSCFFVQV
jgi:cell division protein FtsN